MPQPKSPPLLGWYLGNSFELKKKKKWRLERLVWALWEDGGRGWKVSKYHSIWENESMDQQHKHHHCYYHYTFTLSFKTLQKDVTTILIIRLLSVYIYQLHLSFDFGFIYHLLNSSGHFIYIQIELLVCYKLPYSTNHLSTRKLLMRILVIKNYHG